MSVFEPSAARRAAGGLDLLLRVERGAGPLHAQVEAALRTAIATGALAPGTALPASRTLSAELGVSRSVVTEAYAQLAAEGYLRATPRALVRVAAALPPGPVAPPAAPALPLHDLRPGAPGLDLFPRRRWLQALSTALDELPDSALDRPPVEGLPVLRAALGAYLGRVRGVRDPEPMICAGVSQALVVAARALRASGRTTIAVEDPGHADARAHLAAAGLDLVAVPVDGDGLVVEAIPPAATAVLVTPGHQFPAGVPLAPDRRSALLAWARARDAYVLEDDHDGQLRYDAPPLGALQGLEPGRVLTLGSISKTLAPALRVGWLTAPPGLRAELVAARAAVGSGLGAIEQHALAVMLARGDYDRQVRRVRRTYGARRAALVTALAEALPGCIPHGAPAGLHLVLPLAGDEAQALARATAAGVLLDGLGRHAVRRPQEPALLLGFGRIDTTAAPAAVRVLGAALPGTPMPLDRSGGRAMAL